MLEAKDLKLRIGNADDCRTIWEWRNSPDSRAVAWSTDPIPWEHHQKWYHVKLNDPNFVLYMVVSESIEAIGQISFQIDEETAILNFVIDANYRGLGLASTIIKLGCQELFSTTSVKEVHAFVKAGNERSVKAFLRTNFFDCGNTNYQGHLAHKFMLNKI